jgi:hypothetical protein
VKEKEERKEEKDRGGGERDIAEKETDEKFFVAFN